MVDLQIAGLGMGKMCKQNRRISNNYHSTKMLFQSLCLSIFITFLGYQTSSTGFNIKYLKQEG
jgi:hypothetical protein